MRWPAASATVRSFGRAIGAGFTLDLPRVHQAGLRKAQAGVHVLPPAQLARICALETPAAQLAAAQPDRVALSDAWFHPCLSLPAGESSPAVRLTLGCSSS